MNIKSSFLAFFTTLLMTCCHSSEITFYINEPSEEFYKTKNIDSKAIMNHINDGILKTIRIKQATHEYYTIWLGLYSKSPNKRIEVKKATITSASMPKKKEIALEYNIILNKIDGNHLYSSQIKIASQITINELKNFESNAGDFLITLDYTMNDNEYRTEFKIKKRTATYVDFPT